ncbi:MAG: CoB--CoM heterodisulfide reductase subunit B [Candidatus Eisenbacteria bacterium]|nr:CoB--CoM heterodisulfide reductase subunit B [Candidatus Eisenbacteria bacterium]
MKLAPFLGCMIPIKYPQMEAAFRRSMPNLGVELVDLEGFTCCPDPIYFKARDALGWLTIAARNLSIAEEAGLPLVTLCSGCTATLKEARFLLGEDEELRARVNERLARIGREYRGTASVEHAVVVIRDEIGMDAVRESVKRPLEGMSVAIHYGCHLLKPSQIMHVDDADYPSILEDLVTAVGATPVAHQEELLCCGKGCLDDEMPVEMVYSIFSSIRNSEADCMGLICPTCFSSFDLGQIVVGRKKGVKFEIPIIYFFQLLGLAQGLPLEDVGLHLHKVKADDIVARLPSPA